jgi:hypothetical protein
MYRLRLKYWKLRNWVETRVLQKIGVIKVITINVPSDYNQITKAASAIRLVGTPSWYRRYLIKVAPGYYKGGIVLPSFVSLLGYSADTVTIYGVKDKPAVTLRRKARVFSTEMVGVK